MTKQKNTVRRKRRMPAVAVIFNDKGEILLTQRYSPTRPHVHGKWHFPGGGIEFGEHPRETAVREVEEETGVTVELLTKHPIVYNHVFASTPTQILMLAFPAKYLSGNIDTSHDRQTNDARWFTYDNINWKETLPNTKEIIDEARTLIPSA
jgi:8-oxo-dGTP diphosphatase